jgi:glycosyltransferase involved in cell wall biosynthesis
MSEVRTGRRVAIVLPDLRPGGAERLHVNLAAEWLNRGVHVDFVLRQARGELLSLLPSTAEVMDLAAERVRNVPIPLARYLRKARPDALLAAMWPLTIVAPIAACLARFRGRVVVSEHSPLSRAYAHRGGLHGASLRCSQRWGYPLADARVAVSHGVADDLALTSGLPQHRFDVIHNPAALGKASVHGSMPLALQRVDRPLILTVGTLKKVKRHDLLIDAFSRLPADTGATLCILGEGGERTALERQIDVLGLSGRVFLPGFVSDPTPWYAHADLFVLSSDYEGFGNVIVEAMEQGVPVVSTDCPSGPREILCDGKYGRLVPVNDADALASAMQAALTEQPDKDLLKARARDFAVDRIADQYLDVLLPGWRSGAGA